MPLTPNFSCSQTVGLPNKINFTDSSTGVDAAVTKRRIYIQTNLGTYLVESGNSNEYSDWDDFPATTTITLDVLTQMQAVNITVEWLNVSNSVLYNKTLQYGFILYGRTASYGFVQLMTANPMLINDNNFWDSKQKLSELIDSGNQAIEEASDIYNAQRCYDAATDLIDNSQYYFNGNS